VLGLRTENREYFPERYPKKKTQNTELAEGDKRLMVFLSEVIVQPRLWVGISRTRTRGGSGLKQEGEAFRRLKRAGNSV